VLEVLLPFAGAVVLSLVAYALLPMGESTFVILVGLGPFTLVRPAVVVAAAAGVLAVEPWVHRPSTAVPSRPSRSSAT
jgi:hypothetical protein